VFAPDFQIDSTRNDRRISKMRPFFPFLFATLLIVLGTSAFALDDDDFAPARKKEDPTVSALKDAWQAFQERQETVSHYGQRAQIALVRQEKKRERDDLDAEIRTGRNEVDSWQIPRHHWNNLQREYFQQLKLMEQREVVLDRQIQELDHQIGGLNQEAIRQAEAAGKRVKPLDIPGLLHEVQRVDREAVERFRAAKQTLSKAAKERKMTPGQVLQQSLRELEQGGVAPGPADRRDEFLKTLKEFCGDRYYWNASEKPASKKRKPSARRTSSTSKPAMNRANPSGPAAGPRISAKASQNN